MVLIYGNEPERVSELRVSVGELAGGAIDRPEVSALAGFEGVDDCRLVFLVGKRDLGVRPAAEPNAFECVLRRVGWENVEGLLEPFCQHLSGTRFQYLDMAFPTEIGLLISTARSW
jgi:hypothetical protein